MNNTRNMIFSFLGGAAVGVLATLAILKKTGKLNEKTAKDLGFAGDFDGDAVFSERDADPAMADKPSFTPPKSLDTAKVQYNGITTKPDLSEIAKKYTLTEAEMAEREHPKEDPPEEEVYEEEEEDEETAFENEIGEALMDHGGDPAEYETDGFGHVLFQLNSKRKGSTIYLVHLEHAGEIYPLEDLIYYAGDDVLCDVMDAPIDDVDRVVGDALTYFGMDGDGACGEGPDKLYVRNCTNGFEYEITRKDEYYGAHIYGASNEEVQEVVRAGRKKKDGKRPSRDEEE